MKLTEKETAAIAALAELEKIWPRTLLLGSSGKGGTLVWKRSAPDEHQVVSKSKIKNIDGAW